MTNVAFIPIDNRPVCYQLPKMTVNLDGANEIILPDISLLGDLTKNADSNGILNLLQNLKNIDVYIISLDTIAYGGLIPSRRSNDDIETIKARIDKLAKIIKQNNAKVYAFSSIMRISNNNINEEEKEYWSKYGKKIFDYSYKYCETGVEPKTDIPQEILNDYLETRKRNFEINKYYIELYKQGLFDTLVFSKDDCAKFGFNVKEADELKMLSVECNNIFIKTGADEIPLTLLSRALNKNKNLKIAVKYTNTENIDKISKYEDISVKQSVNSQIELAGGILSDENNCDLIMLVNNFKDEQGELVMGVDVPLFDGELNPTGKPYFIADILNANGSDNNLVNKLLNNVNLKDFYGYGAWNTTGNTLGSTLSAALTYFRAKEPNKTAFQKLQITRFLDDWAYQANVRVKIRDNRDNLTNNIIQKEMKPFEQIIFKNFCKEEIRAKYSFPWSRFFEIGIQLY